MVVSRSCIQFRKRHILDCPARRRIASDFVLCQVGWQVGSLRVPVAVKRAITGAEKAVARSRKRAEKGLCTQEESYDFCAKSEAALQNYLDKQVKEGTITPAERKTLGRLMTADESVVGFGRTSR